MLGASDPEALLISAARTGIAALGGYIPTAFEGAGTACPTESRPQMPEKAAGLLKRILAGEFEPALREFLQQATERSLIAPPETLPALLGLGKNELRPLVTQVAGQRGRWLAAHNPSWAYALGRDPQDAWEHGVRIERVAALEQIRAAEPGRAREWIQATWEQDAPEDRAAFIATFALGLGMDDEPLLESCLDDKRKEVREAARSLLLRLEGSRFVQRAWARVRPLLKLKSKFLGGDTLEVTLPETLDAAAKRDGLSGAQLRKKLGEKANLLAHMLSVVPPSLWSRELGRAPEKLIAAALNAEWKEPVLLGWQLAAQGARDVDWAEAIAPLWVTHDEGRQLLDLDSLEGLTLLMRMEKAEALVQASIKPLIGELDDKSPLIALLQHYKRPWTPKLARALVQSAQRQSGAFLYVLPQALPGFAYHMPPELAAEFATGWASEPNGHWRGRIDAFLMTLNFRNEIRQSLNEERI
jgi:hypothetical protein